MCTLFVCGWYMYMYLKLKVKGRITTLGVSKKQNCRF
jgi:hypothetical protein